MSDWNDMASFLTFGVAFSKEIRLLLPTGIRVRSLIIGDTNLQYSKFGVFNPTVVWQLLT